MYAYLKGKIIFSSDLYLILVNNGVGYRIETVSDVVKEGEEKKYYIYTHVRENDIKLFGFEELEQLNLFEMLIDVSGVGPKAAIVILKNLGVSDVINSILTKKPENLKVPGVGVKTANKIILDLYDKLKEGGYSIDSEKEVRNISRKELDEKFEEAEGALKSLGYASNDIRRAVSQVRGENKEFDKVEELVKYLLREINS